VRPALRWPSQDEINQILKWFACYVLCGLLPLWGGYGLTKLLGHNRSLNDYVGHGEFLLYAASLIGATLFLVLRDFARHFPFRGAIIIANLILLVLAVLFFGGVFTSIHQPPGAQSGQLDMSVLARTSIMVYAVSFIFALLGQYIHVLAGSYDLRRAQENDVSELAKEMQALKD
jgi:hypothetical protein